MANPKSAANAWAKIRTKLAEGGEIVATTPRKGRKSAASKKAADDEAADTKADAGDDAGAAPQTPKKARAKRAPKKKEPAADTDDADAKADGSDDNAMLDTPKKTSRKRTPKKQEVDGEESPKKKPRANQTKKVSPKCKSNNLSQLFQSHLTNPQLSRPRSPSRPPRKLTIPTTPMLRATP